MTRRYGVSNHTYLELAGHDLRCGNWCWYSLLSRSQKRDANELATEIAADLVGKAMDKMSEADNQQVTQIEARFKG